MTEIIQVTTKERGVKLAKAISEEIGNTDISINVVEMDSGAFMIYAEESNVEKILLLAVSAILSKAQIISERFPI